MKKLFIAAMVTLTISTSAFAQDATQIDQKAVQNFESSYGGASKVEWTLKDNFTKASFLQDEQKVEVFYNPEGDFIATTKHVKMEELPTFVKRTFTKKYSDYTVKEAFKFTAEDETEYFVSAENEKESLVLKVAQGSVFVYSRANKM
jgi:hypothetical protein